MDREGKRGLAQLAGKPASTAPSAAAASLGAPSGCNPPSATCPPSLFELPEDPQAGSIDATTRRERAESLIAPQSRAVVPRGSTDAPAPGSLIPPSSLLVSVPSSLAPAASAWATASSASTRPTGLLQAASFSFVRAASSLLVVQVSLVPRPFPLTPAPIRLPCAALRLAGPSLPLVRMTDSKTPPLLDDDDAPIPEMVAPSSDDVAAIQVTRALVNEFLGKTATQDRIREVVAARVSKGTAKTDVDDIVQQANGRALNTEALPHSVQGMRPWVSTVAANAVVDHYRVKKKEAKVMRRAVELDDLPPDEAIALLEDAAAAADQTPAETSEDFGEARLTRWLVASVKTKADRMTFEMIRRKAATKAENAHGGGRVRDDGGRVRQSPPAVQGQMGARVEAREGAEAEDRPAGGGHPPAPRGDGDCVGCPAEGACRRAAEGHAAGRAGALGHGVRRAAAV